MHGVKSPVESPGQCEHVPEGKQHESPSIILSFSYESGKPQYQIS